MRETLWHLEGDEVGADGGDEVAEAEARVPEEVQRVHLRRSTGVSW